MYPTFSAACRHAAEKVIQGRSIRGVAEEEGIDKMTLLRFIKKVRAVGTFRAATPIEAPVQVDPVVQQDGQSVLSNTAIEPVAGPFMSSVGSAEPQPSTSSSIESVAGSSITSAGSAEPHPSTSSSIEPVAGPSMSSVGSAEPQPSTSSVSTSATLIAPANLGPRRMVIANHLIKCGYDKSHVRFSGTQKKMNY